MLAACSRSEQEKEIENMYRGIDISKPSSNKKGSNVFRSTHTMNLEAEMLEEVFCYSPRLGGGAYFLIPTARMQNFGFVDLQPSDVVSGGGGGTPSELLMAQLAGPVPMVSTQGVKNPCLKATLDMVLHNTNILNEMSQMLRNFGYSTNIKLIFEKSTELSSINRLGEFRNNHNNNSFRILLDVNNLPHFSKEVIVSTIYHEVLHAQMECLFNETASLDHERMTSQYLQIAVNSLRNQFPYMEDFTAKALVLSGLKGTNYYNNNVELNEYLKRDINDIELYYKINRKNGSYCN